MTRYPRIQEVASRLLEDQSSHQLDLLIQRWLSTENAFSDV